MNKPKISLSKIVIGVCILVLLIAHTIDFNANRRGDGVSTCLNCRRSEVYALGYCKRCYESFMDYTYG